MWTPAEDTILNTCGYSGHDFSNKSVGCWSYNISIQSQDLNVSPLGQNLLIPSCSSRDPCDLAPWLCCWHGVLRHEAVERQRERNVQCFLLQWVISVTFTASLQLCSSCVKPTFLRPNISQSTAVLIILRPPWNRTLCPCPSGACTRTYILTHFLLWFCSEEPCSSPKESNITVERQSVSPQGLAILLKTFLSDSRTFRGRRHKFPHCPWGLGPVFSTLAAHGNHLWNLKKTKDLGPTLEILV